MEKSKLISELRNLGFSDKLTGYYAAREAEYKYVSWLAAIMIFLTKAIGSHPGLLRNVLQTTSQLDVSFRNYILYFFMNKPLRFTNYSGTFVYLMKFIEIFFYMPLFFFLEVLQ